VRVAERRYKVCCCKMKITMPIWLNRKIFRRFSSTFIVLANTEINKFEFSQPNPLKRDFVTINSIFCRDNSDNRGLRSCTKSIPLFFSCMRLIMASYILQIIDSIMES
jgi:hypothetical protein